MLTLSLGMTKAKEPMPPDLRLHDAQWHIRVSKSDSGALTVTWMSLDG